MGVGQVVCFVPERRRVLWDVCRDAAPLMFFEFAIVKTSVPLTGRDDPPGR